MFRIISQVIKKNKWRLSWISSFMANTFILHTLFFLCIFKKVLKFKVSTLSLCCVVWIIFLQQNFKLTGSLHFAILYYQWTWVFHAFFLFKKAILWKIRPLDPCKNVKNQMQNCANLPHFILYKGPKEDPCLCSYYMHSAFSFCSSFGLFTMLAVGVHFSEQLKWRFESVATGCQDIPGIWLSIRQLGWVAKLFVPQMADQ